MSTLIEVALNARLGQPAGIGESTIESDGRKAKRAVRDLIDAGLIAAPPKSSPHQDTYIVLVDVVLAGVLPTKPTLTVNDYQRSSIIEGRAPIGCRFDGFTQSEKFWMITYPHEYRWFWGSYGVDIDWTPGQPLPEHSWRHTLHVSDQALRDDLGNAQRATKVAALMKQNVGWSLEKIVKIDEATVKTFMSLGSMGFGINDEFDGAHPEMWVATMCKYAERAEAKLATAQAQVVAARTVCDLLMQYAGPDADATDGWTKLAAALLVKVEAKIDDTKTDDDEEK